MPPLPTSSISGSFQPPGPASAACASLDSRLLTMEDQLSLISPVVRHELPIAGAQSQGELTPHSHKLK